MKVSKKISSLALVAIMTIATVLFPTQAFAATKQVDCPDCEGTGHEICQTCYDQWYVDCPDCDWGVVDCDACNGNGHIPCVYCDGEGYCGSGCEECDGSGVCMGCWGSGYSINPGPCQACGETGLEICFFCGGSRVCDECGGKDSDCDYCHGTGICDFCNEDGMMMCSDCYGEGYVEGETCYVCDGACVCPYCEGNSGWHECTYCETYGIVECEVCGGEPVECGTCHGDGDIRCQDCKNGTDDCAKCGGSGKISISVYSVAYDPGEGTSETEIKDTNLYEKGEQATVTSTAPALRGNNFLNWNDGTADYAAGAKYTIGEEDVTLTAVYAPKSFEVSFFTDMEEISFDPINVTFGSAYGTLPAPEAKGFSFLGWYLGTEKIESTTIVDLEENATLSAEWLMLQEENNNNDDSDKNRSADSDKNRSADSDNDFSEETTSLSSQEYSEGTWEEKDGIWQYKDTENGCISGGWSFLNNPYSKDKNHMADWFYFNGDGNMVTGLVAIGENTYYFNETKDGRLGAMLTGWQKIGDDLYYFCEKEGEDLGKMLKNTITPDGKKVDEDGKYAQ